jgi:hypothetical protein
MSFMQIDTSSLKVDLNAHICEFVFVGPDEQYYLVFGTLMKKCIPQDNWKAPDNPDPENWFPVWDTQRNKWQMIPLKRIFSIQTTNR